MWTKNIGIWLDHKDAWIIRYDKNGESVLNLKSEVESKHKSTGGTRMARAYFFNSCRSHHKMEERRRQHTLKFFKQIMSNIMDVDALILFGPSSAKDEFKRYLSRNKGLLSKLRGTIVKERMSLRQMTAFVRSYFGIIESKRDRFIRAGALSAS